MFDYCSSQVGGPLRLCYAARILPRPPGLSPGGWRVYRFGGLASVTEEESKALLSLTLHYPVNDFVGQSRLLYRRVAV